MYDDSKSIVLDRISADKNWASCGHAKYLINNQIIHVRFCSTDNNREDHYKFNINPNTLSADYELWICGDTSNYYQIPIQLIYQIYNDPNSYWDHYHPEIKIVSVNIDTDSIIYSTGAEPMDINIYRCKTLLKMAIVECNGFPPARE